MIIGIGTDIVKVSRLAHGHDRFGLRYAERILAPSEIVEFSCTTRPAHFLAKRFAAKEAAAKAFRTGFRGIFGLRDIAVAHDAQGGPHLVFSGEAARFARERRVGHHHLSLTDEDEYAVAFVILESV